MIDPKGECKYDLRLVRFDRQESEDGKILDIFAGFNVMHGVAKPLFKFTCDFIVQYVRHDDSSMAWKDFSSAMALAHIVPYLREYVSSTTARLPAPMLMLDPINTNAMIADYEGRKRRASESKVAPQLDSEANRK